MTHDEICKRILDWRAKTARWKQWFYWYILGIDYCPFCERPTRWRFDGRNPIHPEGPPLFFQWVCRRCNAETGLEPSPFLRKAHDDLRGGA